MDVIDKVDNAPFVYKHKSMQPPLSIDQPAPNPDRDSDRVRTIRKLYSGAYKFLDYGCSRGGSIALAQRLFGKGNGLGLDIDPTKVAAAQNIGYDAMVADLTALPLRADCVDYVILSHFLEHLSGLKDAEKALSGAVRSARSFVYVAQPWFDSDGYLFSKNLKLYWSDWHGHPNRMTSLDFHFLLNEFKRRGLIEGFSIFGHKRIRSSAHEAVHPLDSGRNQHEYDAKVHSKKPFLPVFFTADVFAEIHVLIDITQNNSLESFRRHYPDAKQLFDSNV